MEKSIFGSAIKTYPSKRNRFSSYRPSCLVFKDDDPFDQLIKDEENKKPLTVKKSGVERGVVRSTKSYFPSNYGAPVLRNIQNYSCVNRKSSILPHTKKKKARTKILKRNKENTLKCSSRLFKSNSDSDNDLRGLSVYDSSPSLNPLAEYKKRKAFLSAKPKPKSPPPSIIKDIIANSCISNNESEHPRLPSIITDGNNSTIDRPNPTHAGPNETVFKKPTVFIERSSDLFYKNSHNKNRGQTKTRKKLSFLNESYSFDNEYDADNSCEYANKLLPRISGIRRSSLQRCSNQRIVDELFNSDNENENEYRCSDAFNPGIASTPNQSYVVNNAEDENCEKPPDNSFHSFRSSLHNLSNNSIGSTNQKNSPLSQNEVSSQNFRLVINETQSNSKNDEIESCVQPPDCSSDSYAGSSTSGNNFSSSALSSDSEQEQTKEEIGSVNNNLVKSQHSASHGHSTFLDDSKRSENLNNTSSNSDISEHDAEKSKSSSENDSLRHLIRRSTPPSVLSPFSPNFNHSYEITLCKLFEESFGYFKNDVTNLINQLNSCSLESEEDRLENADEFTNNVSDSTNELHSSCLENEQDHSQTESVSVIENTSTSVQTKEPTTNFSLIKVTTESEMKETPLLNETTANQTKEITNSFSLNITTQSEIKEPSLSELIVCLSPIQATEENTSENDAFAGWSEENYRQASELKKALENVCKELEPKSVQPEDEIPAHLKQVTRRRKKTFIMPTLNEENSNLEDDEVDLNSNTRISVMPSQNLQVCSQNQTTLHSSRFLERSSMISHSIVLATGKKWRRSFITLKNIREYGFQMQTEHENLKGRCWRKNVEDLISNQIDENLDLKEIGENSTIRTCSNETFLNPNYTCLDNSRRPNKARFSLCVNQKSPPRQHHQADESSGLTSSSDTSKFFDDKSYISFVGSQQNSRVENNYDLEAGDYPRSYKVSLECYDIRDHLSAKERVLRYCKQTEPLPFDECFNNRLLQNCKKIGEGVYGEVFMLKRNRAHCSVLKVIPIEGDQLINGEKQKKFDEIVSELVISIELSDLRKRKDYYTDNFAELQKCWCVYGKYPKRLIDLWEDYNDSKGSDNDSPKVFDDSQLYIILELSHGGEDVESFVFNNAQQALSVFTQVAYALAVAERAFNFEHRDLHWGNILVSKTKEERTKFVIGDFENIVRLRGVKVTIIDYTLSRITINNCIVFNDIGQDPDLFTAQGDFQFEVYRLMRDEVKNIWNQFIPKTNVYWLCYLLDKMIKEVRYRRVTTQIHQTNFKRLEEFYELILGFASCHELICHSYFTRTVSANR